MDRAARGVRDAGGDGAVAGRGDGRAAYSSVGRPQECSGEVGEPVRVGIGIIIEVSDDLAYRRVEAGVAGRAQTLPVGADHSEAILAAESCRSIARSVVDNDDLEVRVVEPQQPSKAVTGGALSV